MKALVEREVSVHPVPKRLQVMVGPWASGRHSLVPNHAENHVSVLLDVVIFIKQDRPVEGR